MFPRKAELKVPIRDRRRRRRILTLKNFGAAMLVLLVVLVAANFVGELRDRNGRRPAGDYGRIIQGELPTDAAVAKPAPQVIREAPIADQTVPDPMLTAPLAREEYLGTTTMATESATVMPSSPAAPAPALAQTHSGSIAIVGDTSGVAVVTPQPGQTPKLSGGIFKQP